MSTPVAFPHIGTFNALNSTINVAFGNQTFSYGAPTGVVVPPPTKRPLPRLTAMFTGREDILEQLIRFFDRLESSVASGKQRIFVLYGLGGSGKTQLMLKFVAGFSDLFTEVHYIDAGTLDTLRSSLEDIARVASAGETADDALRWLSQERKDWLLLFDNADDPSINLRKFFPPCTHGNIIVTTRNTECRMHAPNSNFCVSGMVPDDATELLLKHAMVESSDENRATCAAIASQLGYLALAIAQAGAYIARSSCLNKYLRIYQNNRKELMRKNAAQTMDDYQWSVYTTWEINIQKLSPPAEMLLRVCAFLHYDGIPCEIFQKAAGAEGDNDRELFQDGVAFLQNFRSDDGSWSDFLFLESVNDLASYSLINLTAKDDVYSIHPLVHTWARDRMHPADYTATQICAMQILALSITGEYSTEAFCFCRSLVPHIDQARSPNIHPDIAARFQEVYLKAGRWADAETLQEVVVAARQSELGDDDPKTLRALAYLAIVYHKQGRYNEAQELEETVLDKRRTLLGRMHPDTLVSMANIAAIYSSQCRWTEAETLQVEVLDAIRNLYGNENQDTLILMNALALTYCQQARWKEAEALQVKAAETRRRLFGDEHPDTLIVMNNLALTYCRQGRLQDAEALQMQVLETRRKVLGDHHPNTLTTMHNLAWTYSQQNRWEDAEALQTETLQAMQSRYPDDHPSKLATMNDLALTYTSLDRLKEAEALQLEVIELKKGTLGNDHPTVLSTKGGLVSTYRAQGRLEEAETLGTEVMVATVTQLGREHPETLANMNNLALVYTDQGRLAEAEVMQVHVTEATRKVYGDTHPNTMTAMTSLASNYKRQGEWKKAESLLVTILETKRTLLGDVHLEVAGIMESLAIVYCHQDCWEDALPLQEKVFEARRQLLGATHRDALVSMSNLARTYTNQGRWQEAKTLVTDAMVVMKRTLGEEHRDTLTIMSNLAYLCRDQGQLDEAKALAGKVAEGRRKLFGEDHPNALRSAAFVTELERLSRLSSP